MFVEINKVKLNQTIKSALDELRNLDIREFGLLENIFVKEKSQIFELDNLKQVIYYFKSVNGKVFVIDCEYFLIGLEEYDLYKFIIPDLSDYSEYQRIQYQRYGLFDFQKITSIEGEFEEQDFPF